MPRRFRIASGRDILDTILNAVLPLFGLILLGYVSAKRRILGGEAVDVLNRFVVWLALPALLFQAMAQATMEQLNQPGYIGASLGAISIVFLAAWAWGRRRKRRLADISMEGLCASYANTGYMGIPLCVMLLGDASLPIVVINILMTACVLFAFSIVLIEIDRNGKGNLRRTTASVGMSLLKNPLVMAPVAGAAVAASQIPLPPFVFQFTGLLSAAASPCALVTIGLFLAQDQPSGNTRLVNRIVLMKLVLHPLVAFALVRWVFDMPPMWATAAVLLAALPIGTGPFMLAKLYDLEPAMSSRAILISTVVSVVTLSLLVSVLV
ncbi:hypothetical protein EV686_101100 [Paracandidimonas soli]|uniref:Malonate transporter n=1 Tax=Paracandidimonas soli TaxID=1917182 RepID=A0A4R3VFY2_9BURK|nr:hypothetical protein EV686_101100 [Paracandidimonas soli]